MGSIGNPKTWVPYVQSKDCSQGFCSLDCPQWCYIIDPPPPPLEFPEDNSGPNFSPLVIAVIGILASAFLLVSYYTIISKYCGNSNSTTRRENHDPNVELEENHNPSLHEPWHVATTGLDEALIKSITVCKYKKGDGLIEGTDCSVCLGEFQEDESVRLLPKCSHAFHVPCIDTWLRSHSTCPLCRANIVFIGASQPLLPPPVTESPPGNESLLNNQEPNQNVVASQDVERNVEEETMHSDGVPKSPLRAFSDLGNLEERHTIIEIRGEGYQSMRRSISMDHSCQGHLLVADILRMNQGNDVVQVEECHFTSDAGSSKQSTEVSKFNKKRILHCVMSPVAMKRSFSSGRFLFTRQGRARETTIPL